MIAVFTYLLTGLLMHPVHETVAEVEWNEKSGRLEVALRLSVLDEQWIGRQSKSDDGAKAAIAYLQKRFRIDGVDGPKTVKPKRTAKYHWIGREERGSHVWWYFELEPTAGIHPKEITQRMLFERNEGYINRVVLLSGKKRSAITLTISKPTAKLR